MQASQQPQNAKCFFSHAHGVCLDNGDIMMPPTSKLMTPLWWVTPGISTFNTGIESQSPIIFFFFENICPSILHTCILFYSYWHGLPLNFQSPDSLHKRQRKRTLQFLNHISAYLCSLLRCFSFFFKKETLIFKSLTLYHVLNVLFFFSTVQSICFKCNRFPFFIGYYRLCCLRS